MENNIFIGPFKKELFEYYNYKITLGYRFKHQLYKLKFFDKYTYENYNNEKSITKKIVTDFIEQTNTNKNSKAAYASLLRQLALYLSQNNIEAYIIPMKFYGRGPRHIPYIFSENEVINIFKALEKYNFKTEFSKDIMIILFKILYCTGMRISEALNIRVEDINFEEKTIAIYETKNNVERLIGLNDNLYDALNMIIKKYNIKDYIFTKNYKERYSAQYISDLFKKILYYAKIKCNERRSKIA